MLTLGPGLQERVTTALHEHLRQPCEDSLHEGYELGRSALEAGLGIIDMVLLLLRAARTPEGADQPRRAEPATGTESFLLECLAPYEMALRGVREANATLRELDVRRERDARRLAHELHDEAGQIPPALGFLVDGLRGRVDPAAEATLDRMRAMVDALSERLRRLSHELRPVMLDDLGLDHALRFLAEGVTERSGLRVRVEGSVGRRLSPSVETALYRAVQEALHNVVRHASATTVVVELHRQGSMLTCRVIDDGRGFPPPGGDRSRAPRGLGLDAMRERIAAVGGRLEIGSRAGGGAVVAIQIASLEVPNALSTPDRR